MTSFSAATAAGIPAGAQGHVFISYARNDGKHHARRLEQALRAAGISVWRDVRDLDPHQDFSAELENAIERSRKVICCITPDVRRKDSFVRREVQYTILTGKPIIPLVFNEEGWLPIQISTLTYIDFSRQAWDSAYDELIHRLADQDDRRHGQVDPGPDAFRPYLEALYRQINRYLEQTVFALISLSGEAKPDAVTATQEMNVLPASFFVTAGVDSPAPRHQQYASFVETYEEYAGRVLLLGEPGAGKTTTLFAFAREMVTRRLDDSTQPLPVLVPVAGWDATSPASLVDWLTGLIPPLREHLPQLIEQNEALLLLDGLDELGREREDTRTKERYDPRQRFLKRLDQDLNLTRAVITCRVRDYEEIGTKVHLNGAITLRPLDDGQMQEYLKKLPDLWDALDSDPALRNIARTPLVLSLFTAAYREATPDDLQQLRDLRGSPGDTRDRIFETFVRRSYEREARKPNADLPFTLDQVNNGLGRLAMNNVGYSLAVENVIPQIDLRELLSSDAQVDRFTEFCCRLYLLLPRDDPETDEAHWQFVHLLLRDYFAFRYSTQRLHDPERYAGDTLLVTPAMALGKLGDWRAIPALIEALHADLDLLRLHAVDALSRIRAYGAINALVEVLHTDPNPEVRSAAAFVLGRFRDTRIVQAMLEAMDDPEATVRRSAAHALGRLRDQRALQPLVKALTDPDAFVRSNATAALGKLRVRDPETVQLLIAMLADAKVAKTTLVALKRIATPEARAAVEAWQAQQETPPGAFTEADESPGDDA